MRVHKPLGRNSSKGQLFSLTLPKSTYKEIKLLSVFGNTNCRCVVLDAIDQYLKSETVQEDLKTFTKAFIKRSR